jgi:UDPglucose--hexose-1-phosphate uridylyltransferase
MLNTVESLLLFSLANGLLEPVDIPWARNRVYDYLNIPPSAVDEENFGNPDPRFEPAKQETAAAMLSALTDAYTAYTTTDERDRHEAGLMNLLMPRPSEVYAAFILRYVDSALAATRWFYALCQAANYIQVDRINQNIHWRADTAYGALEITVNLSKPEKDPRAIAAARGLPPSGYPKCLLCFENSGFAGFGNKPARQNLRAIPLTLCGERWHFQYSPYVYYNEHCIVFTEEHVPMLISEKTFRRLVEFLHDFPHYFIGSNAGLPVVGGSILDHEHFQGGNHPFPIELAKPYSWYTHPDFPLISVTRVAWPLSVIRLTVLNENSPEAEAQLITLATLILEQWQRYDDAEAGIHAFTGDTPHNAVTPIARHNGIGLLEMDLVLRNNRTSAEHPDGIFHPHANLHHIKKENIGLIEVMGLAILPGRLQPVFEKVVGILSGAQAFDEDDATLALHADWIKTLIQTYGTSQKDAEKNLRHAVGQVFMNVLSDCGVFKDTEDGRTRFGRFMGFLTEL